MSHTTVIYDLVVCVVHVLWLLTNLESLGSGGVHSGLESQGSVGKHFVERENVCGKTSVEERRVESCLFTWVLGHQSVIIEFAKTHLVQDRSESASGGPVRKSDGRSRC